MHRDRDKAAKRIGGNAFAALDEHIAKLGHRMMARPLNLIVMGDPGL
jgi:hypothetical protein